MRKGFVFSVVLVSCLAIRSSAGDSRRSEGAGEVVHEAISEEFFEKISGKLDLSDKQKKNIESVIKDVNSRTKAANGEMRKLKERMEALEKGVHHQIREAFEKVRAELDFEQRERFDEMRLQQRKPDQRDRRFRRIKIRRHQRERDDMEEPFEMEEELFMDDGRGSGPPGGRREYRMHDRFPPEMWEEGGGQEKGRKEDGEIHPKPERGDGDD